MYKTTLLTLAGVTAAATAGTSATLHFDLNGDPGTADTVVAAVGDTLSWSVYGSFDGYPDSTAYFGGFVGDFLANNPSAGQASNVEVLMPGNATTPTTNGANIEGINMFASALLGNDDPANPLMVMTFDTEVMTGEGFNYSTDGTTSVFPDDDIFSLPDEFESASVITDSVIIPAPGALAVLGLGGLGLARRRR